MDNRVTFKWLAEIKLQCRFALLAWKQTRSNLAALEAETTFFYVHALLQHSVSLSRICWPIRAESKQRGDQLREILKLKDSSPLQLRDIRGHLDKDDEWLEDWIATQAEVDYVEMNLMPLGTIADYKSDSFQRSLDPETWALELRGITLNLKTIEKEIRHLELKSEQWMRINNPW